MVTVRLRLRAPITCGVVCAVQLLAYPGVGASNERIRQIIENVCANEALYENIEVRILENYKLIDRKPTVGKAGENTVHELATIDKDIRYVSQSGMFRVDVQGQSTTAEPTLSEERIAMFDGKTARVLDQKRIGNVIAGRLNDVNAIRPHMLLLRNSLSISLVPLSTLLQGDAAMIAADVNWDPKHTNEITYQGEEEFQSLKCHKFWLTTSVPHEGATVASSRSELWLAEDRNYIPVRLVVYDLGWSRTLACKEASVSGFQQIEEGIWFPVGATVLRYDSVALHYEKRQKAYGRYTYDVKSVTLNPTYDVSFFRDLTFPAGTSVYEVENGKIVKSYTVGLAGDPALRQRRWLWWILWANLAVALAIVGAVYMRHRRKRRKAAI
jgi:hypothetical protein